MDMIARGMAQKAVSQASSKVNKYYCISNRVGICMGLSDGTKTGSFFKHQYVTNEATYDIRVVYPNFYGSGGDNVGANDISVKASIEYNGAIYPVFFNNGSNSVTIKPGGIIESDSVAIDLPAGAVYYVRTYVSVATLGQKWPSGAIYWSWMGEGTAENDLTAGGPVTPSAGYGYIPLCIVGPKTKPSVLIVGDSITTFGSRGGGYISQAFGATGASGFVPIFNWCAIGVSSEQAANFQGTGRQYRMKIAKYFSHAMVEYGINDLNSRTADQIKADLTNIWNALSSRGLKVFQCTITPHTTSTDNWKTAENQTVWSPLGEANRVAVNNWIRTKPAPLVDYFEIADLAETARNSGIWIPDFTGDGLHPKSDNPGTDGQSKLSTGIILTKFV